MKRARPLTSSKEDYLEAIRDLQQDREAVRVTDIATRLAIAKPSVSQAIASLRTEGLVEQEPYGRVFLTPAGRETADRVRRRHAILRRFLTEVLGVPLSTAEQDACRLEHAISSITLASLVDFLEARGVLVGKAGVGREEDPLEGGS